MSIVQLEKDYIAECARFKSAREKSKEDEGLRIEARKLAQRGLGLAISLKQRYTDLREEKAEYAEKVKEYDREIERWQKWLVRLGSPMNGIPSTTFDDVAGLEDVKETIRNYLFALKNPEVAKKYRVSTNVGILLYGPPGTGKTLVAKAIAHELGVRFFVITPSMIFGSYVGESEKNVRDIFAELRACEDGAVLLIDECESIFARRENNTNRAAIGVANQLLQEMNGVNDGGSDRRVILGATNRPELMDEAYLRYKRFSLQFLIGMPNKEARQTVVDLNLKKLPHDEIVREELLRRLDESYTCADISGIIEQCAYRAMEEYREKCEKAEGKSVPFVNINVKHLREVLKNFSKSVTPEMIRGYEEFRDARRD